MKKKILTLSGIILGIAMCFCFNKVQAIESAFTGEKITRDSIQTVAQANTFSEGNSIVPLTVNIVASNYKTNTGKTYWVLNDEANIYRDLYCLNVSKGFGAPYGEITASNSTKIYNQEYDFNNLTDEQQGYLGINDETIYNKVKWVLNNIATSESDLTVFLAKASDKVDISSIGLSGEEEESFIKNDMSQNTRESTAISFEDVKMVQQVVVWHFTNPSSIFENTLVGISYADGRQISGLQEEQIEIEEAGTAIWNGKIKQAKFNAIYDYLVDGAESATQDSLEEPTLTIDNSSAKVKESSDNNYFVVGPYLLQGTNTDKITKISYQPFINGGIFINKEGTEVTNIKSYIGNTDGIYFRIPKTNIAGNYISGNITLTYTYDGKDIIFLTDTADLDNTQPIATVKDTEKNISLNVNVEFELMYVEVTKQWDDANNQDGIRPSEVKVQLYQDGVAKGDVVTLNESNNWKYNWEKLISGKNYEVKELDASNNQVEDNGKYNENYTTKYEYVDVPSMWVVPQGFQAGCRFVTITNTHIPETTQISGTKTWDDVNNQDGKRPESITVRLLANGTEVANKVVTKTEKWAYTFSDLPVYEAGNKITYTIEEDTVTGYETTIDGYNITNKYTPEETSRTVTKIWNDNNNQDGKRPETIQVQLLANGQAKGDKVTILDNNGEWTYTWNNLPKYENGQEIVYTVVEDEVSEYATTYSEDTFTITNSYTPGKVNKTVIKIWEDSNNQDGKRPETIQVQLLANNQPVGEKVSISEANGQWTYTWNDLPKYENGKEIVYTVVEDEVSGYTTTYSEDTFTITNSYTPEKVNKTVTKVWKDEDNFDQIRPEEVTVTLYKIVNEEEVEVNSQKLSNENWTYTWNDLPKYENGQEIVYTVRETAVDGYTTTYSEENYSNTDTITITNTHILTVKGKYTVTLRKVDNGGNQLEGAVISVNGKDYTVGMAQIAEAEITSDQDIILTYEIEEKTAPVDFIGLSAKKTIKIKLEVEKFHTNYVVKRAYIIDNEGNQTIDTNINLELNLGSTNNTIIINLVNNPVIKELDFSLRKFITGVTSENGNQNTSFDRAPIVDTSTIATTGTATYKHTKEPIAVEIGDIVTYTIRVYNEGEVDGYISEIKDHLPEWLDFLPDDELNLTYLWEQDIENNRIIKTKITAKDSANGESIYSSRENKQLLSAYNGGEALDYIDVQVRCKVNEKAQDGQLITNIADISGIQDKEGIEITTDRDSTIDNVVIPADIELPNYIGNEENKIDLTDKDYYYKGQEDDDDFEKVLVKKFDLSLRKFIIAVNGTELKSDVIEGNIYTREPKVDTSKLGTTDENGNIITTATYAHTKEPVEVKKGDVVTYTIRVYNEGSLSGYANEIIENIPEGLEFISDSEINKQYGWILREDGKLVTSYLADKILNKVFLTGLGLQDGTVSGALLDYKDVQVELKVIANPTTFEGDIITNWAEINVASNKDIDSTPGNDIKTEDDIDYEPVKLVHFDLELRKFITNVNGTEYNNRAPEVDTSKLGTIDPVTGEKITTAEYKQTKDPVVVETGSTIVYTIRVYNEGTLAGYVNEITDTPAEGLEFLPENEINVQYKWTMIDEEGNITQDVSKAKKFTTNYLSENNDPSKIIDGYKDANGIKTLSYQEVKVAFKVIEPNNSDRIVINVAEITGSSFEDSDSIPGNNITDEDDIDNEYVRVEIFDLALEKWVKATKVTYKGKTKTTKTGFTAESTEMAKVDLVASQLNKTTVKFVYCIRVVNEGQVAGYATEIKDYVPSGLKFVQEDNKNWVYDEKDKSVTTTQLKDKLLQPGQSETVEIVLTWKNSTTNLGVKTNWAEISADSGDDIDSTPNNNNKIEDDIDDAKVILSIKTGGTKTYIALIVAAIVILGGGTYMIKKKVLA